MAKFSKENTPAKVLILDAKSGGSTKSEFNYSACLNFFKSLGCHVQEDNQYTLSASDQVFRDDWDLICIPDFGAASDEYTQFTTVLGLFDKADIPVFIANNLSIGGSGSARTFTGVTAYDATSQKVTATGIENWEGRMPGNVSFYAHPATAWDSTVTPHLRDASDNLCMFSKSLDSHNMLIQVGYNSFTATVAKPWYGAQWMIDQCPDADRKKQIKNYIKKRYVLMRWDMLGTANDASGVSSGNLLSAYNTLVSYGVSEIWLAALWQSGGNLDNTPDYLRPDTTAWFLARDQSKGGKFRCMNHETDIVDGTGYTPNERCTTDAVSADNFKNAANVYETHCTQLADYGFKLENFGKGLPNVQNGNDMNNPSAHFLTGSTGIYDTDGFYGGYEVAALWITDEGYPSGVSDQVSIRSSIRWGEGRTILGYSCDGIDDSSATELPTIWNADIVRCAINGGGIYYHAGSNFYLHEHADEYGQLFTTCPDIMASGPWEDMLDGLKNNVGIWFDG